MLRLYRSAIAAAARRRDAERAVSARLIAEAFGPGAHLAHDPDGRPQAEGLSGPRPFISLSHCRTEAVLAVSDEHPVGVDIEQWRPALRSTMSRWLTEQEAAGITDDRSLLQAWTAKEAIFKALPSPQPASLMGVALDDPRFTVSHLCSGDGAAMTDIAVALRHGRESDTPD